MYKLESVIYNHKFVLNIKQMTKHSRYGKKV